MAKIFFTGGAAKDYKKLPNKIQFVMAEIFDGDFANNPLSPQFDLRKLKLPLGGFRMRVGVYRMLFTFENNAVTIYSIKHRKDAYKKR